MPTLNISPATSLHFKMNTTAGSGSIHAGANIADNYLYNETDLQAFYNNDCLEVHGRSMPFNCADTTAFQFEYENGTSYPIVEVRDENDTFVSYLTTTLAGTTDDSTDVYNVSVDFSTLTCGACYSIKIFSVSPDTSQSVCASNGTFDTMTNTTTGGNNVLSQQASPPAQGGAWSGKVDADAAPAAGSDTVFNCTNSMTLSANTFYVASIYVYEASTATNFTSTEQNYYLDVTTDFTDATVFLENRVNIANDGEDTWHQVWVLFKTGSDVTGVPYLKITGGLPTASGDCWIDTYDVSCETGSLIEEAESEIMSIQTNHDRTIKIEYTAANNDAFGIFYSLAAITNVIRIKADYSQFRMEDGDLLMRDDSENETHSRVSKPKKVHTLITDALEPYMIETLTFALKHPSCMIDGIEYRGTQGTVSPEWKEDGTLGIITTDLTRAEYPYIFTEC